MKLLIITVRAARFCAGEARRLALLRDSRFSWKIYEQFFSSLQNYVTCCNTIRCCCANLWKNIVASSGIFCKRSVVRKWKNCWKNAIVVARGVQSNRSLNRFFACVKRLRRRFRKGGKRPASPGGKGGRRPNPTFGNQFFRPPFSLRCKQIVRNPHSLTLVLTYINSWHSSHLIQF